MQLGHDFKTDSFGYDMITDTEAGKLYYVDNASDYSSTVWNLKPGDTIVIRCKKIQIDPGTAAGAAWYSINPSADSNSIVVHVNSDSTLCFSSWNQSGGSKFGSGTCHRRDDGTVTWWNDTKVFSLKDWQNNGSLANDFEF
jgi:hypothetical protein